MIARKTCDDKMLPTRNFTRKKIGGFLRGRRPPGIWVAGLLL
jgi:hypothetical protein